MGANVCLILAAESCAAPEERFSTRLSALVTAGSLTVGLSMTGRKRHARVSQDAKF